MKEIMIRHTESQSYNHEFNVSDNGELWTSDDKLWSSGSRNQRVMSLEDDGNGYILNLHEGKRSFRICYHEAVQMYILLSEAMDVKIDFVEKTVVKSI